MGLLITIPPDLEEVLESVVRKERAGGDDHAVLVPEALDQLTRSLESVNYDPGSSKITSGYGKEVFPLDCEESGRSDEWKCEVQRGESPHTGKTRLKCIPVGFLKELLPGILSVHSGRLKDLLKGSKLQFPGKNSTANDRSQRSKFRERLQLASEEREYQCLTADVAQQQNPVDVQSSFRVQFGIAANLVLGIICMSVVGYVCSQYIVKTKKEQMIVALICGIAMMLLEVCVFVLRSNKADRVLHQRQNYMRRQMTGVGEQRADYRPIDTRHKRGASSGKLLELPNRKT